MRFGSVVALAGLIVLASCSDGGDSSIDLPIDCNTAPALSLVSASDDRIFLTDYPLSGCGPLTRSFLFRNTGGSALVIEGARIDDARFSVAVDLPQSVAPGETIAITLGFRANPNDPGGEVRAQLTLEGDDGCFSDEAQAVIVTEGGLTLSDADAVDFGEVPVGVTRSRDVTISWQRRPSDPAPTVLFFSVDPEPFMLLSAPATEFEPAPCDTRTIRVSFTAPVISGLREGALLWEQESNGFFGLSAVPLFATVVPSP